MLYIDDTLLLWLEKGGSYVARPTNQRGKCTKLIAIISDSSSSIPVSILIASASSLEIALAEETFATCFVSDDKPEYLIGKIIRHTIAIH